jgi:branched-subunit amino acid transport protein
VTLTWIPTLVVAGLVTFGIRLSFIALLGKVELPHVVLRSLRFVPPAVLSAIILPEVLVRDGAVALDAGNTRLLAGAVAALVAWRTRSVFVTIAVGMAALWAAQALLGT